MWLCSACERRYHNRTLYAKSKTLQHASQIGHVRCVKELIAAGANVNYKGKLFTTSLLHAVQYNRFECAQLLVEAGADVNCSDAYHRTSLMLAMKNNHIECVKLLVDTGADLISCKGALSWSAKEGQVDYVKSLIAAGADVNHIDQCHKSCLAYAVDNNHGECVNVLIESGANVESCMGKLVWAARHGSDRLLELIIKAGANVNNECNESALWQAAAGGHSKCVKLLINAGAYLNLNKALRYATRNGKDDCVDLLLKSGADVNATDFIDRITPLCLAVEFGHATCIKVLAEAGADVNERNKEFETPLMMSVKSGNADCVKALLAANAKINMNYERNALSRLLRWRTEGEKDLLVMLLLAAGQRIHDDVFLKSIMLNIWTPELDLKYMCREKIRTYLLNLDPYSNLFCRISRLGLPKPLVSFLLYYVDLSLDEPSQQQV